MSWEYVSLRSFFFRGIRVWLASQTRRTITMSGKNALRKKRFTKALPSGYRSRRARGYRVNRAARTRSRALGHEVRAQHADVGQVPVALGEVEAVADHELVRDLEADVADGNVDLAPFWLRQQRADLEARRLARLQVPHQVGEGQPRIDDVLDDEDVAPVDVDVEVLEDPDDPGGVRRRAVAGDRHEVDLARHGQRAHEVGHEEDRALEDAYEQ